ncbi:MAG: fatty acid desaturase [Casimicrobiaceae bacterium]|nr:fatty acid desaturase [Casimicrobiaceae bacterium]
MAQGFFVLPWWGYVLVSLGLTHLTIVSVTIYLHRCQAHRALDLHPAVAHVFRFWLWLTTGMVTKQWVAIHRKHHAKCETPEDPHSPVIYGHAYVLRFGVDLYRKEARNRETLERYGYQTPDDWIERNLYSRYEWQGMGLLLIVYLALFGVIGLTLWAVQLAWIPFFAAGIINGTGHHWGYRNYETEDASTNIFPIGILIGGEELHNNHHAFGASAKFSHHWYEVDIGWLYIRILSAFGLARVKRVAPTLKLRKAPVEASDAQATVHAIITHRYRVMREYGRMLYRTAQKELSQLKAKAARGEIDLPNLGQVLRDLRVDAQALADQQRERLAAVFAHSETLAKLYQAREELAALWRRSSATREELAEYWIKWRQAAEASNIPALRAFSSRLTRFA